MKGLNGCVRCARTYTVIREIPPGMLSKNTWASSSCVPSVMPSLLEVQAFVYMSVTNIIYQVLPLTKWCLRYELHLLNVYDEKYHCFIL